MLGKLLKYEYRSTARTMIPFYVALLVLAVVNRIFMIFQSTPQFVQISQVVLAVMYGLFVGAIFVMTILVLLQRFHKNLMGQEGYLMFTLPVTPAQNLLSKAIVSFSWFMASILCTILSILILIPDYNDFLIGFHEFMEEIPRIQQETGINVITFFGFACVIFLVALIQFIFQIYTAICIGHQANDHKFLASFGAYVGIQVVLQIVNATIISIVNQFNWLPTSINRVEEIAPYCYTVFVGILIEYIILIAAFFFIDRYLLSKRLNLE